MPNRRALALLTPLAALLLGALAGALTLPPAPNWMAGATVYQMFVRNDTPQGTLAASSARLDEVRALGVNTIYLLPIYPTGALRGKGSLGSPYSVKDYEAIDPRLGSLADFDAFVSRAHTLGLRVILDIVFNHTAWDNPLVKQHPEWYLHDASGSIRSPQADWSDVAGLDTARPDVQAYLTSVGLFWLGRGVDGFRADVSGNLPLSFWQDFRAALKAVNPQALLLAETGAPQIHDRAFDLSYDWEGLGRIAALANGVITNGFFDYYGYQGGVPKLRYLENHDQERIAGRVPAALLRPLAALLLTEPGVPLIYAGQEVGLTHRPSLFDRDPLNWAAGDADLKAWYSTLLRTRANLAPLTAPGLRPIGGQPPRLMAFTRFSTLAGGREDKAVVLINLTGSVQTARLPWARAWRDALGGELLTPPSVVVPAYGTRILLDH